MVKPHGTRPPQRPGQASRARLAPLLAHGAAAQAVRHLETYLAILQGKGSGTGWDLAAEVQVALAAIRRPNAAIIDVGGGRGDWTAAMLASLPLAQVWLLEPSARALYHLAERGLPRTTVIPAAAGDQPGNALLLAPRSEQPIASLHRRRDSYFQQEQFDAQPVQVVTLDQIIAAFHLDVVDFVKIDVEGHELAVLQGVREPRWPQAELRRWPSNLAQAISTPAPFSTMSGMSCSRWASTCIASVRAVCYCRWPNTTKIWNIFEA